MFRSWCQQTFYFKNCRVLVTDSFCLFFRLLGGQQFHVKATSVVHIDPVSSHLSVHPANTVIFSKNKTTLSSFNTTNIDFLLAEVVIRHSFISFRFYFTDLDLFGQYLDFSDVGSVSVFGQSLGLVNIELSLELLLIIWTYSGQNKIVSAQVDVFIYSCQI